MLGPAGSFPALLLLLTASSAAAQSPDRARETEDVWQSLVREAGNLQHDHQYAKAVEIGERALAGATLFAPDDPRRAITLFFLGNIYRDWGHCTEARANYAQTVATWRKSPSPDPKAQFTAVTTQISAALECNDLSAAENLLQAHSDELSRFRSGPLDDASILGLQSGIAFRRGRYGEAENLVRRALRIFESSPGVQAVEIADLRNFFPCWRTKEGATRNRLPKPGAPWRYSKRIRAIPLLSRR